MAGVSLFGQEKQILATWVVKLMTYYAMLFNLTAIAPWLQLRLGVAADHFANWDD